MCSTNECETQEDLCEGGGRGGPALVQHAARKVPAQRLQEGAAHVVQEVVVVGAVLLVAVDEALNQPIRAQDRLLTHTHTLRTHFFFCIQWLLCQDVKTHLWGIAQHIPVKVLCVSLSSSMVNNNTPENK